MIKVVIVDDSALIRRLLTEMLGADPDIEVVGTAPDPYVARDRIKALNPDVITLDIEMPRMDGITFLQNLMRLRPMPVVMISTLTQKGAQSSLEALRLGAVECIGKPQGRDGADLQIYAEEIVRCVKAAAAANVEALTRLSRTDTVQRRERLREAAAREMPGRFALERVIAIGASTGGTEAIAEVVARMPASAPPVVVAQHIPEMFSRSFSERVDGLSAMNVQEARDGEVLDSGCVYIAPGNHHLRLRREGDGVVCVVSQDARVNRHRPSVEVLFESVARAVGPRAVGVLLTGMGSDGALGMQMLREAGARTLAQDRESSVVWGMPGSAVELNVVDRVVPLDAMAEQILDSVRKC